MPVAGSLLTSNNNTTPAATFNTASISPGSNRLILAAVYGLDNALTTPPTFTLSGNGLTWVSVLRIAGAVDAMQVFRAMGASPSAGAVTIDADVATLACGFWSISEYTGVNKSGTNGSGAIGNTASNSVPAVAALTVTLPAFASAGNGTYGAFFAVEQTPVAAFTFTPGSGFSELAESVASAVGATAYIGIQSQWRATNDTSVDVSTSATVEGIGGIALEIVAEVVGGGLLYSKALSRRSLVA